MRSNDLTVEVCATPRRALSAFGRSRPDVLLYDVDGAGHSGWKLVQEIRAHDSIPILIISERAGQEDIVSALELGADDYVTKPLPMNELLARIRVALRRARGHQSRVEPVLRVRELEIDLSRRTVVRAGHVVRLTSTEFALLRLFTVHHDELLTERMLLESVWGPARLASSHLLHVYIARLRKKLEADLDAPSYLITEAGAGYRFATSAMR